MAITIQAPKTIYNHYCINEIVEDDKRDIVRKYCEILNNKYEGWSFGANYTKDPKTVFNNRRTKNIRIVHHLKLVSQSGASYEINDAFDNSLSEIVFTFDEWVAYEKEVNGIDLNYTSIKIEYVEIEW